ncbi:nSTAND1 domain-containing NTPase [Nocardia sp. NPDC003999]
MARTAPSRAGCTEITQTPRAEFVRRLGELYEAAGNPSLRQLAAAAQRHVASPRGTRVAGPVSAQRISDWKAGRTLPARFETFTPVLLELVSGTRRRRSATAADLLDVKLWKRLWLDAQPLKAGRAVTVTTSPFPGSAPYTRDNAAVFTGRQNAIRELLTLLHTAADAADPKRVVALVGAAGVGKTSLIEAGLVPALENSQTLEWQIRTVSLNDITAHDMSDVIADSKRLDVRPESTTLLIIDGFESYFSPTLKEATRDSMRRFLTAATKTAVVLISLRPDWTCISKACPLLADTLTHRSYLLEAMEPNELRAAITEPARLRGVTIESGLEELLLAAVVGSPTRRSYLSFRASNLAILSMSMSALWPEREGTRLTVAGYQRIGGIEGVLHRAADTVWDSLSLSQRPHAMRLILSLVSCREGADDTRRRVARDELDRTLTGTTGAITALRQLMRARVITATENEVFLSHDLMLTWPRLVAWLDGQQSSLSIAG